jgi:hypothetical protein
LQKYKKNNKTKKDILKSYPSKKTVDEQMTFRNPSGCSKVSDKKVTEQRFFNIQKRISKHQSD